MSAFSVDTGRQTTPPLVDGVVHNRLVQFAPHGDESSLTLVANAGCTTSTVNKELSLTDKTTEMTVTLADSDSDDDDVTITQMDDNVTVTPVDDNVTVTPMDDNVTVTQIDVDVTDKKAHEDNTDDTTQTSSALPEAVQLSTVDRELNLDDRDDWLASLLKYDTDS